MSTKRIVFSMLVACAMVVAATANAQDLVYNFDCGLEGWYQNPGGNTALSWANGKLIHAATAEPNDPHCVAPTMRVPAVQYIVASFTVSGAPDGNLNGATYAWVASGDDVDVHQKTFTYTNGQNLVVIDMTVGTSVVIDDPDVDIAFGDPGAEVLYWRFDLPESGSGFTNQVVELDWTYVGGDPNIVPVQDTTVCPDPNFFDAAAPKSTATIDGVVNPAEYGDMPVVLNNANLEVNGSYHESGVGPVTDAEMSGTFYFSWDANFFYAGAIVLDDSIEHLTAAGGAHNATDEIQVCLDYQAVGGAAGTDPGLHIHDLTPGTSTDANVSGHWQHWPNAARAEYPNVVHASSYFAGGYMVEMAIPWTDMTPNPPTPSIGDVMGYVAVIMDYDAGALTNLASGSTDMPWVLNANQWPRIELLGSADDWDDDGLSNDDEILYGTDPYNPDTDGDGISDGDEVHIYGTNPLLVDTDGDGASDSQELFVFFTDPLVPGSFPVPAAGVAALLLLAAGLGGVAMRRMRK